MVSTRRPTAVIDRLKNPTYTGENRCLPCTVVNVVLAGVLAVFAGVIGGGGTVPGVLVATIVFGVALGVIYVRGYLVPGTPQLTKRYVPDRVLATVDKIDASSGALDPKTELRRLGVVETDPAIDDLVLSSSFDHAWLEAIVDHTATETELRMGLADVMGIRPERLEIADHPSSFVAFHDGDVIARWESRAACRADVGGAVVLSRIDRDWYRRSVAQRLALLATLRFFLERCPTCAGEVSLAHGTVESCCRTRDVAVVTCTDCDARIAELPIDVDAAESAGSTSAPTT